MFQTILAVHHKILYYYTINFGSREIVIKGSMLYSCSRIAFSKFYVLY